MRKRRDKAQMTYDFPPFYNLFDDPKEEYPLTKATAGHLGAMAHGRTHKRPWQFVETRDAYRAWHSRPLRSWQELSMPTSTMGKLARPLLSAKVSFPARNLVAEGFQRVVCRATSINPTRLGISGSSSGGYIALLVAMDRREG